jgi:transposase-like protein
MARPSGGVHRGRMHRQYTKRQRSQLIQLVADGHATVPQAAARFGIAPSTAYEWLRKRTIESPAAARGSRSSGALNTGRAPTFARLVPSAAGAVSITVRVGRAEVLVPRGFDAELLRGVVTALSEAAL